MKRTSAIAAVTAAALALSLAACGSADSAAASSAPAESTAASTEAASPEAAPSKAAPAGDFDTDQDITVISREDGSGTRGAFVELLGIEQAEKDFAFLHEIPGRKIILKGNHDYWWTTATKFYHFCAARGWDDMFILNNNCYFYGETALCGTRGWFYEQEQEGTHDEKIFRRELGRLEASLKAAGDHEKLCFLHLSLIHI